VKVAPLLVTVVSRNAPTLDGLKTYLEGAGVLANTTAVLERVVEMTPPAAAAVILFPDEYEPAVARAALGRLKNARPNVLAVIVTHEPRRFEEADPDDPRVGAPLVLAKPAWAWTILDAVRARLQALASPQAREQGPRKGRP
jgi:hypothetical protein